KYVYINAVDNDIVVDGDNAQEALDDYRNDLASNSTNNHSTNKKYDKTISGSVTRVALINDGKNTIVNDKPFQLVTVIKGNGVINGNSVKMGDNFVVCADQDAVEYDGTMTVMICTL
ncbi:MAG: hypothetical protein ACLR3Q_17500, partial [Thomasclavelia ramosa]